MTDIVERIRTLGSTASPEEREAADEIERLRAALNIIWIAYQDETGIRKIFFEADLLATPPARRGKP